MHRLGGFDSFCEKLEKKGQNGFFLATGCVDAQKAQFITTCGERFKNKLILTFSDLRARELYEDLSFFDPDVYLMPTRDLIFFEADIRGNYLAKERMKVLKALLEKESVTVVMTLAGCMDYLLPLERILEKVITVDFDTCMEIGTFADRLLELGYHRVPLAESPGQFAVRGFLVDVYPINEEMPVRIEFFDDEINQMRLFDPQTQMSVETVEEVRIYPAEEMQLSMSERITAMKLLEKEGNAKEARFRKLMNFEAAGRVKQIVTDWREKLEVRKEKSGLENLMGYLSARKVTFLEYFSPENTLLVIDEPARCAEHGRAVELEFRESMTNRLEKGYILPGMTNVLYSFTEFVSRTGAYRKLGICSIELSGNVWEPVERLSAGAQTINSYQNNFELLMKDLNRWKKDKFQVILVCPSGTRARRLAEEFRENGITAYFSEEKDQIPEPGHCMLIRGKVQKGYQYAYLRFAVISESDFVGRNRKKKKGSKTSTDHIKSFQELKPGDYVIHENYGVGIYRGIEKIETDDVTKDYMKIEYDGNGSVYVPATALNTIQKYTENGGKPPKLNRIGGVEWNKTKNKVKKAVEVIAEDLVELYASRSKQKGFEYSTDTTWQKEFEELFPYEETEDQLKAIAETKLDMESEKPMDRLICGDVGFGKTEVAIRAAFKAVQDGKQVAYLVPTTILAQQHYSNFVQRMQDFPVRVDLMCRLVGTTRQNQTIRDLKKGMVDIVIGTHRLLSKDVEYKDLGLLIIDEEQRFGVKHKEKIKQLKENVDVLTLTATPIPRTLHMSLIGIREMSVLEEAPIDRVPIQTYVMEHNEELVREAINRELARSGQVFYVYNRVDSIAEMAESVRKLVPDAVVEYAHGQMEARKLEKIMYAFINGEIDVLVSTTIIETGLDISNVNTIIVHDSDRMGLSQLYQLRGRVGRSNRTAYCFLMYRRGKILAEVAEKRLGALREFTELGSGFKISMRDLEIRGAGNLLGESQSGHMAAVGYDLYCKMLNDAVLRLKGEKNTGYFDTTIDLNLDAYIPASLIPNEAQKLEVYRRIAALETEEEGNNLLEEILDRYGDEPREVNELVHVALFKAKAHACFLEEVRQVGETAMLTFFPGAKLNTAGLPALINLYRGSLKMDPKKSFTLVYNLKASRGIAVMEELEGVLSDLSVLCQEKKD